MSATLLWVLCSSEQIRRGYLWIKTWPGVELIHFHFPAGTADSCLWQSVSCYLLNRLHLWPLWESLKDKRFILLNRLLWSLWKIFEDKRFIKEACCRVYMVVLHFPIGQCSYVGKTIWLPCAAEPFPLDDGICVQYVYLNILEQSNDFH